MTFRHDLEQAHGVDSDADPGGRRRLDACPRLWA